MAQIISVASSKGGVGKSTLATSFASALALRGADVVLIDTDVGQASSRRWADRRARNTRAPRVTCIERSGDLEFALADISKKWDIAIVDVAGRDSSDLRGALMMSDIVLVPTSSAQTELEATAGFSPLLRRAAALNPEMRSLVVLNRLSTHPHAADSENVRAALEGVPGLTIARSELRSRLAYDRATILGLGVLEYSDSKAKKEFAALLAEVLNE